MIRIQKRVQLYAIHDDDGEHDRLLNTGDIVRCRFWSRSFGLVVASFEHDVLVLWSVDPWDTAFKIDGELSIFMKTLP